MSRTKLLVVGVTAPVLLFAGCVAVLAWALTPVHKVSVPNDASPPGFHQVISWTECGVTGDNCGEVVIFGSNERSFREAAVAVEDRLRGKGWIVLTDSPDTGYVVLNDRSGKNCVSLQTFDKSKHLSLLAPKPEAIAPRIAPYAVVVLVTGFPCP